MVLLSRMIYLNPVMTPKEFEMMTMVALSGMPLVMLLTIMVMGLSTAMRLRDKPGDNGVEVGIPADGDTPGATTTETGIALGGPRGPGAVHVRTMDGTTGVDEDQHPLALGQQMAAAMKRTPRIPQPILGDASCQEVTHVDIKMHHNPADGALLQMLKEKATVESPSKVLAALRRR